MTETIAVLDLGKTNSKFLIIDRDGRVLHRARQAPVWRREAGLVVLDDAAIEAWLRACLAETARDFSDVSRCAKWGYVWCGIGYRTTGEQ